MQSLKERWSITVVDGVAVRRPGGVLVCLPTRKTAGLIAVLVFAEGKAVPRRSLEEILWSEDAPTQRAQSLRSALTRLRQALGEGAPFEIGRTACRLCIEQVHTDYPLPCESDRVRLAPEMHEPWFVHFRESSGRSVDLTDRRISLPHESVAASFGRVLTRVSYGDPVRTLDLMRAAPELACSLPGSDLRTISDRLLPHVGPADEAYAWLLHFTGVAQYLSGEVREGMATLWLAAEHGMSRQDTRLVAEAFRWHSAPRIVTGDAEGAARDAERLLYFVSARGDREAAARLAHAQGVAYHHTGRFAQAEAALGDALASPYYQRDTMAQAHLLANIAIFRAARGAEANARVALKDAGALVREVPNWRVHAACSLAQSMLHLAHGEDEAAETELSSILRRGEATGNRDFTAIDVYAHETTAALWVRRNERSEAQRHLREGMRHRRHAQMGFTRWDQQRLKGILATLNRR